MLKKGLSLTLTVVLMLMLSTATFAGIQLNPVEAGDITLIEPQIGSEAQVFVKDSMAISIRTESDHPVTVSLYKVMPSSHDAYLDEACESEMITRADEVPFKVISGSSIVARDAEIDTEEGDQEDSDIAEDIDEEVDSDKIIDGSEALLQKDKLSSKERQSVIKSFKKARNAFEDQLEDLEEAYAEYLELFPDGHESDLDYTDDQIRIIKSYLVAVNNTLEDCESYEAAKDAYEAIFEIPLFGPEDLSDTGILPYYQKTVEKITPGLYKFVFSEQGNKEIIEVIEFEVVKKEELTEEDIKDAMPSTLGDLILPAKDIVEEEKSNEEKSDEDDSNDLIEPIDEEQLEDNPATENTSE